jgi:CheY-like chemotaxis protein
MGNLGLDPELRDANTIRAYLDELALTKAPVHLWVPKSGLPPFETTIVQVARDTFSTAQTPALPADQHLMVSFTLDARRLNAATQVAGTGVFRIPRSVTLSERRQVLRATFSSGDGVDVFLCERVMPPFLAGRTIAGRLVDLGFEGLCVLLEEVDGPGDAPPVLRRGDTFEVACIRGLPYTPAIQCGATLAHLKHSPEGETAGFHLEGLAPADRGNIERVLARRFPATFGQSFPARHRKTDLADQAGAPVATKVAPKAPEVVLLPAAPAPPPPPAKARPEVTAVMRLRKAARRILVLSAGGDAQSLADALRADDFKRVTEARSYLDARRLAEAERFDLVLLDVRVGGHQGQAILDALRRHDLLLDTPVILVGERRDARIQAVAEAVRAVHVHDKGAPYDDLVPALYRLLL